jgi:adenylate kinase
MIATKKDGGSEMKRKGTIIKAREAVLAAGKSAAERTKVLAGEVANAAATAGATAKAASTAAASAVLGTVATAIQVRAAQGANALAGEGAITASPAKKKIAKRLAAKKRAAPKKKAKKKKTSRKAAKKK